MIPHKQLLRHSPENGVYGDCWRTAIACLLEVPVESVPHVYENGHSEEGHCLMNEWLGLTHKLRAVEIPIKCSQQDAQTHAMAMFGNVHYYMIGKSETGCGHAVVCHRGKIVHDPSQTDSGIVGPLNGLYWLGVLAREL